MAHEDADPERLPDDPEPYPGKAPAGERELSDDELEKQAVAKTAATDALEDGQLQKALESFTEAIIIGNVSAMLYAKRADVLLKLKRPCACISDCSSAIEINPDSAKAYRIRGIAYRKIGQWEDAHKDISLSQKLDYDDDLVETQKFVAAKYEMMKQRAAEAAEAEAAAARAAARAAAAEAATAAAAANAAAQPQAPYAMHEAWRQAGDSAPSRQAPPQRQADSDSESCEEMEMEPEASPYRQQQRPAPEHPRMETRQQANTCEMGTQMHEEDEDEQDEEEEEVEEPQQKAKEGKQDGAAQGDDDPEHLPMDPKPYPAKGPEGHQNLSDAQIEKQGALTQASAEAVADGNLSKALDCLTQAIVIGNPSAQMYAKRAEILLKLKRPCACIADCHSAVEINPDSAKAYRTRGKAWRTLGEWEQAHKDISLCQKIDYDDSMVDMQKLVAEKRNAIVAKKMELRVQEERGVEENLLRRRKAHDQREEAEAEAKAVAEAKAKKEGSWRGRCASCARRFRGPDPSEEDEDTADADPGPSDAQAGSNETPKDSTDDID